MTRQLLRLDSSIFGINGASTQLNEQLIEKLQSSGDLDIIQRDLAREPLPHVTADFVQALGKAADERSAEESARVALADKLIDELRAADILVVAAPMYNYTVPSTLKTWMDYVARAGTTFKYTSEGQVGLLGNTQVYITASRGGLHKDQVTDNVVPLLTSFFRMLGLTDVKVIYAEGLNLGDDSRENALTQAAHVIDSAVA